MITTGQQFYLKKLGGADITMNELGPVKKLGMGRRSGQIYTAEGLKPFYEGKVDEVDPNLSNPFASMFDVMAG